jgi:4-hydroxy-tetrahydrodipicolinate reductase
MPEPVIGVCGTGRLGQAVRRLAEAEGHVVRVYDPRKTQIWRDGPAADVLVDCSAPAAADHVAEYCEELGLPLVECVSELGHARLERLRALGSRTAVVLAANLSLGNYLQTRALRCVADVLTTMERAGISGVVPEAAVLERHPATKSHRPSTTALRLAREWTRSTGSAAADVASLRSGPPVSEHSVMLAWPEQELTITHHVSSLKAAAAGAVGVAGWAVGRAPGTYTVHEVFDDMLAAMAGAAHGGPEDDR